MPVLLSHEGLFTRRIGVEAFIRKIVPTGTYIRCDTESRSHSYSIGVHSGSAVPGTSPRDWRFETYVAPMIGNYFEYWTRWDDPKFWLLEKSYLQLYTNWEHEGGVEFLCLHCDPAILDDEEHAVYKRGPHLHVGAAIPHAHIALSLGELEGIVTSVENLMRAMERALKMLQDEVLDDEETLKGVDHGHYRRR